MMKHIDLQKLRSALIVLTLLGSACSGATTEPENNKTSEVNNATPEDDMGSMVDEDMMTTTPQDYSGLVLNEVVAAGDPADWVELVNASDTAIDLSGCTYTDDATSPDKATFAAGTTIEARGRLVVEISDETAGFKLGGEEEFVIFSPTGEELVSTSWLEGESPAGGSYARLPDITREFQSTGEATRGEVNKSSDLPIDVCGDGVIDLEANEACDGAELGDATCEAMGFTGGTLSCKDDCTLDTAMCETAAEVAIVINEVTSAGDDQIELYNAGDSALDLSMWFVADSNYPAEVDSRYIFADGTMIGAGEFLVLTKDVEHTFGVGKDDTITLYDASGAAMDQVSIPTDAAEVSYCRQQDGTDSWASCDEATFGESNAQ